MINIFFKSLIYTQFFFFLFNSWAKVVDYDDLQKKGELYFEAASQEPFTGNVTGKINGKIVKGKREGYHTKYYESGQILSKAKFKENKLNGKYIEFYDFCAK